MRTVYLIGNGFDINLGLPTKYTDFYRYYLGLDRSNDSKNVSKLKEHLSQCLSSKEKYWSDLEEAMGRYTTELNSFEELEEVSIPKECSLYWQFHLKHYHLIHTLCPDLSMMHLHDLSGDR